MAELSPGRRLLDALARFVAGTFIGQVEPPRDDAPGLPDVGAREFGLRRLREFLAALPFMRTMEEGKPPRAFAVPIESIYTANPGSTTDADHSLPYVAFLPGAFDYNADAWLGPPILQEDTADLYAPGTALYYLGDHNETFMVEVVAEQSAMRRAIIEGIAEALSSSEESAALKLSLPDYFGATATFLLAGGQYFEEENAVRNRRRSQLSVMMTVPRLKLAPVEQMRVMTEVTASVDEDVTFGAGSTVE